MPKLTIDAIRKQLPERERRYVPSDGLVALRSLADGDPTIGITIPFGARSVEMYGFTEQIAPGAFTRTLKNSKGAKRSDVVALWNHDPNWVLGRQSNNTLVLRETDGALEGEITLDGEDPMHRHFARRVERRDVQGSSFAFETVRDEWETDGAGDQVRTLVEVKLFDVSPVTYPAYPDSTAEGRAAFDIAIVRSGVDLGQLATVLHGVTGGKVPPASRDELRSWITRLEEFVPADPKPLIDWEARQALRERVVRNLSAA